MGRLRKVTHQDVPLVSSIESADSLNDPFVPNDFTDDGSNAMTLVVISVFFSSFYCLLSSLFHDDGGFDKALFKFYLNHKVKSLNRKLSCVGRRNVVSPPCYTKLLHGFSLFFSLMLHYSFSC
ncbi:hypothetical protein VPH35_008745 [Triticum aestivum]